jgi:hypothetical protein
MVGLDVRQANFGCLQGDDGWLFISEIDSIMEKHRGEVTLSATDLERWRRTLELREAWVEKKGAAYRFALSPNKVAVYGEHLPNATASSRRPWALLSKYMARNSSLEMLDPTPILKAHKKDRDVYFRTDEHWNDFGAWLAYRQLMADLPAELRVKVVEEEDLAPRRRSFIGGLAAVLDDPPSEEVVRYDVREPSAAMLFENKTKGRGKVQVFENRRRDLPRAVMYRDSFGSFMLPFLAESFSRLVVVSSRALIFDLVEVEMPDLVLTQMVERYLGEPPHDLGWAGFAGYCGVSLETIAEQGVR